MAIEDVFSKGELKVATGRAPLWWKLTRWVDLDRVEDLIEECHNEIERTPNEEPKLNDYINHLQIYYHVFTGEHYKRPHS